ncbi:hypothetical protein BHU24_25050 [Bacillus pseudomycoides]|uniref:hypothetical protein n=1 Tax=Bacillus pseudomycoides TaxID=64104 RepID=UPI000BEC582B|nr:hypothetical protein [Bacillus pseudomycoides]MBD5799842.1 hypothetical protein [Bacillus pseudomycoides]MED1476536.1 hypothetical protein [Bacillus pseudomycoides]PDZ13455.1 hypothetical protein CON70_01670 [Bacillus pseudomycoides]PEO78121.1 hypothetical protein CN571_29335 [Bacillus pseudomycoides]
MSDSLKPFERMNYFPGQLLTAKNFKDEQTYMNEKRQLINRLIFGRGIVEGLNVVQVGESGREFKITIGVAFDEHGQEIVVSEEKQINVNEIPFTKFYVWVEYSEEKKEPLPPIDPCSSQESCNYNRWQEFGVIKMNANLPQDNAIEIAYIERDDDGKISNLVTKNRQYVYSNPSLFELISKMDKTIKCMQAELDILKCEEKNETSQ